MKKLFIYILSLWIGASYTVQAQHMVKKESYLKENLVYEGLPDYPPFGEYKHEDRVNNFYSAFFNPVQEIATKYGFKIKNGFLLKDPEMEQLILKIRSGEVQLFFGAYSSTKLFTGINPIYPAVIANPIHVITLPETQEKIKSAKDLAKLRGVISKTEYLSDFVIRKIKPLNLEYVDKPIDAYEKLFTGEVDYIIGGLYYNRIMASRYGIEQYMSYSTKPLFKIPVFIALSRVMPQFSLYEKDFSNEFSKPEFAKKVKEEIIRMVEDEITANQGVVPPAFAAKVTMEEEAIPTVDAPGEAEKSKGRIIEQKVHVKTIDEVLDGI